MYEQHYLKVLSALIRRRNFPEREISEIIGRPAHPGHLGEFIASQIFHIDLVEAASNTGFDGRFAQGELAGMTV